MSTDYLQKNKHSWNNKVQYHLQSEFYAVDNFIKGKSSLNQIELALLGDVKNKSVLHLQCHFGQDTLSLARMGANATGIDLSDKAIDEANKLSKKINTPAQFICSDVYDLPSQLKQTFDIVFTSYGTIGWLPDLSKWAQVISHFLKPGGKFVFAEFHPVVWMFDNDFKEVGYNYFNTGPIVETETGTYADTSAPITQEYVGWNHGIAEVINCLTQAGLQITQMHEFDYSPYNCFKHSEEFEKGKYRITHLQNKIPMVYSLAAIKK